MMESLRRYGQRKPLVANLRGEGAAPVLEAGSGTLEAARRLGWRFVAVVFAQDDERTARGYGAADNRRLDALDLPLADAEGEPGRRRLVGASDHLRLVQVEARALRLQRLQPPGSGVAEACGAGADAESLRGP